MVVILVTRIFACDQANPDPTDAWLDRIEKQAARIRTFEAAVRYDRIDRLFRTKEIRHGRLIYRAGPPAQFAISFDKLIEDGRPSELNVRYIFDGRWLVERYDQKKLFIKRAVVASNDAESGDPLAGGIGPFPVPVTFEKAKVKKQFEVSVLAFDSEKDPPRSIHVKLIPKPNRYVEFEQIDIWYDTETLLPVRLRTLGDARSESVVALRGAKVNQPVDRRLVDTSEPTGRGWRIERIGRKLEESKGRRVVEK